MAEYITLTCPSCGSKLNITENIDRFACSHCGNEYIVNRGDGIISISPIIEGIEKVQRGTDKTASELAINRLNKEIAELDHKNEMEKAALGTSILWIIFAEFIIIGLIYYMVSGSSYTILLISLGVIIFLIYFGFKFYKDHAKLKNKKRLDREKLIKMKKKELRKHLDEVSD